MYCKQIAYQIKIIVAIFVYNYTFAQVNKGFAVVFLFIWGFQRYK